MLQAILVIGQYAYCPEFLGITRIARFNRAIPVLPKIFGQYAYCPESHVYAPESLGCLFVI